MSKCWYCNNELTTGDNPKHFGICNKCYDEMFKSGNTIIRSLTNKISELQKQLEEKDNEIEDLKRKVNCYDEYLRNTDMRIKLDGDIIKGLQDELHSQPAEIVEKIRKQIFNLFNVKNMEEYERLSLFDSLFTADAVTEILDTILKEYQK